MSATTRPLFSFSLHLHDLLKLSKYRLSGLVALTASAGFILRYEPPCDPSIKPTVSPPRSPSFDYYRQLSAVTIGTFLSAASANTLNQLYEIRSDAKMARTRLRPLPSGRVAVAAAGLYAALTGVAGVGILSRETNNTAAAFATANLFLYAAVYTPLKPLTTINTWIGAVVGGIPPLIGWTAGSGGHLTGDRERGGWLLATFLFLWQIPHFHALAVMNRVDYARGGLKMLAVKNPIANAWWARKMSLGLIPIGWAFVESGVVSGIFGFEMALLGMWMARRAARLVQEPTCVKTARALFRISIWQLPLSLGGLMLHSVEYGKKVEEVRKVTGDVRIYHPWEVMAPFPFLPVPVGPPLVVMEREDR